MGKDFAKLTGELAKGIKIGESSIEIKLTFPLKAALPHLVFLSNNQGEELNVFLGDPQMSFDFDEEDDAYKLYTGGRRVTADASGVVTSVEQPEKDENQAELRLDEPVTGEESERGEDQAVEPVGEPPAGDTPAEDGDELSDYEKGIMGEGTAQEGSDLPDWMKEPEGEQPPSDREMSFEDTDQKSGEDGASAAVEENQTAGDVEISPEELEQYILSQRPSFPDLQLDFPRLFERKRKDGVTWREIAKEVGMTSGQLSGKISKYKEEVKKVMMSHGVA
ncbi:hypothetical protein [Paenibacillus lactis]|uniref:Uncharacterized protein n=1 Tax=Paenibacillus lactis 154 TaxID=743719 RepID=G4HNT2_9BACL|nr:hypothetical protein [Paenibacillus lactis]EHB50096.1 hypothetical protein PaelaDRAFT_5643 [Paenibacillus lactis 154]